MNKLNFSVIRKITMFTNATNKFWNLVMTGLADADGFKIYSQVCVWLGFPPLIMYSCQSIWWKFKIDQISSSDPANDPHTWWVTRWTRQPTRGPTTRPAWFPTRHTTRFPQQSTTWYPQQSTTWFTVGYTTRGRQTEWTTRFTGTYTTIPPRTPYSK